MSEAVEWEVVRYVHFPIQIDIFIICFVAGKRFQTLILEPME